MNKNKNNLTNEIRRVRAKLLLFEQPGCNLLLFDLIDDVTEDAKIGVYATPIKEEFVRRLKGKLERELESLLAQQEKYQQGKLNL